MITEDMLHPKVWEYLNKLDKEQIVEVMLEALEVMQGYNGNTINYCVVKALGGEYNEELTRFRLPKI